MQMVDRNYSVVQLFSCDSSFHFRSGSTLLDRSPLFSWRQHICVDGRDRRGLSSMASKSTGFQYQGLCGVNEWTVGRHQLQWNIIVYLWAPMAIGTSHNPVSNIYQRLNSLTHCLCSDIASLFDQTKLLAACEWRQNLRTNYPDSDKDVNKY